MLRIPLKSTDEHRLLSLAQQTPRFTLVVEHTLANPLTDQAIAMATLAFANGASIYLKGTPRSSKAISPEVEAYLLQFPVSREKDVDAEQRRLTRGHLGLAITDPDRAVREFLPRGKSMFAVRRPAIAHVYKAIPGGLMSTYFEEFPGIDAFIATGTALFLDVTKGFRRQLCRCTCGIFFFEIRGGGTPARKYCCKEHRDRAHTLGAPARNARARSGVRIRTPAEAK